MSRFTPPSTHDMPWNTLPAVSSGHLPQQGDRLLRPHQGMHRLHGCSAATTRVGSAPQEGEPLTPDQCVDIMATHENYQANTPQGILDAISSGQTIAGTVADANESRNLGKYCGPTPDVP
jgi:hypothetical protein